MTKIDIDKILHLLKKLYESDRDRKLFYEILVYSKFIFKDHWNQKYFKNLFDLDICLDHEIFLKHFNNKKAISDLIKSDLQHISVIRIDKINLLPDYDKIEISNSEIRPIYTEWEDINRGQQKLIEQLERSTDSIDFQNIGNSSRILLGKLAKEVFNPEIHKPTDSNIDIGPGKFKNQLHSYINAELTGKNNKELKQFAESAIEMIEKSIDLANSLTHKLEAERTYAEVCVVSTLSAISIIKLVEKNKKK